MLIIIVAIDIGNPSPITPSLARSSAEGSSSSGLSYTTPASIPTPGLSPDVEKDSSSGESGRMTPVTPESAGIERAMSSLNLSNDPSAEDDQDFDDDWGMPIATSVSNDTDFYSTATEEVVENLWADYGTKQQVPEASPDEIVCSQHGKLCRKGICAVYKKQKREAERRKQEAERKNWRSSNNASANQRSIRGGESPCNTVASEVFLIVSRRTAQHAELRWCIT